MKKIILHGTPRPHYLQSGEFKKTSLSGFTFRGKVLFNPEVDQSLVDRDHVNMTHQEFAIWNMAHTAAKRGLLFSNMRVVSNSGCYFKEIPMNHEVDLFVEVIILREDSLRMKGLTDVVFENEGKVLAKHQLVFVATK